MSSNRVSVVIPSYHEEENLRILLPRLNQVLQKNCESYEILVIDTMAPIDNTSGVCVENQVRYVPRKNGNYYGCAVRTGISESTGEYIVFMDADGSHPPEFIEKLLREKDSADLVIASRYIEGGGSDNVKILKFMSQVVNLTFRIILGLRCKDVSNSFKLYRSEPLKKINLVCNNFDIIEEILIKLSRQNKSFTIVEIPFFFRERMFGHTKRNLFAFMLSYLHILIKLRFMK